MSHERHHVYDATHSWITIFPKSTKNQLRAVVDDVDPCTSPFFMVSRHLKLRINIIIPFARFGVLDRIPSVNVGTSEYLTFLPSFEFWKDIFTPSKHVYGFKHRIADRYSLLAGIHRAQRQWKQAVRITLRPISVEETTAPLREEKERSPRDRTRKKAINDGKRTYSEGNK
ncbi:hypothetical protein Trydic_g5858 [Trypoxylus dichotomus]